MIKLPNLDDQVFEDIVETARRRARQYCPEWTNFNDSDPGLTILELFAWLKEMQQYHLNQVTSSGILSCLRLLGISPRDAAPAETIAVFKQDALREIPQGFPFATDDGLVFETRRPVTIGGVFVAFVWIDDGRGPIEVDGSGADQRLAVQPFGLSEREGSSLYIGFSAPPVPELSLYFEIDEKYPVARTPFGGDFEPSRDIVWEYGANFDAAGDVKDGTRGFSVSGEVTVCVDGHWEASKPATGMPKCYWLRARLTGRGVEESPKIKRFFKDYTTLYQHETLSRSTELTSADKMLELTDYQGITGNHILFSARENPSSGGWKHIKLPESRVTRTDEKTTIQTGGKGDYRVVSVKQGFNALLSTKTNLPGVTIEIPAAGYIEKIGLMIEDGGIWHDWSYVEQLHTAGPYDRVFTVDSKNGNIVFGDNEHGACPPAGTDNVIVADCRITQGAAGNILPGALKSDAVNITYGQGGRDPESLEQALTRMREMLSSRDRCVTREDYEQMAAATPGTRIMKARAAEGYDPKTGGSDIPALVTVVIQPYGADEMPLPDTRMLERVARHLEKGRLLTTRLEVAAPEYVPVSVRVAAVATDSETAKKSIKEALDKYLSPTLGSLGIGALVSIADVTAAVSRCAGVSRVLSVTLGAPENAAPIDRSGNVALPPHKIAYAGEIEIQIST